MSRRPPRSVPCTFEDHHLCQDGAAIACACPCHPHNLSTCPAPRRHQLAGR